MSSYVSLTKNCIHSLPSYVPGRPIEEVARESGQDPEKIIKLASNENPLGPSPKGIAAAKAVLAGINFYPEDNAYLLKERLSQKLAVEPKQIVVGQGSSEIITMLGNTFVEPGVEVVMGEHAFICYKRAALLGGGTPIEVPLKDFCHDLEAMAAAVTEKTRLLFLPSPNNPTAGSNKAEDIVAFAESLPDSVIFCFDGAYEEYLSNPPDLRPLIAAGKKIICLRSFSKIYGLAGLRIGYGYGSADLIELLDRVRAPFNVSAPAQAAALAALDDVDFVKESITINQLGCKQLQQGLRQLAIPIVMSEGNFLLAHFESAKEVFEYLQANGVIVRPLQGYGLPDHLRITVGTGSQNQRLLDTLAAGQKANWKS